MMYLSILILPFLSFFSTNLLGRFIGIYGCCILSTASILTSLLFSICALFEVSITGAPCTITLCPWFQSELFIAPWGFYFDSITIIMLLVVCTVSSLVHLYSTEYLSGDPHQGRFMGYLSLFTGFMLVLVSADNFLIMFFGWEGIGLASFLLIGYWYTRIQAGKSAIKAMLVNRIGDLGLALGIAAIFLTFKSLDYFVVFSLVPNAINTSFNFLLFDLDRLSVIAFLLFWGALGKSAQIGLHIWLPDAMEGPTPVSALIHAATLVTAGVFLIIRCSVIFENSNTLSIIAIMGALTALFASSVGLVQNDMKRVIAYSTCSQLGYMVFSAGISHYSIALFHLANHALFKALLFLSAGCIIHGMADEQDMRKMGSLIKIFPLSYTLILIGSLALVGFPFLTGFYSKDAILEVAAAKHSTIGNFTHILGCLAALCTSFYSFRLIYLIFVNNTNTYKGYIGHAHDGPILMTFPLIFLAFGAIFWGFLSKDMIIGLGSPMFGTGIINNFYDFNQIDAEFLPAKIKNIPFICTLTGILLSTLLVKCGYITKEAVYNVKMLNLLRGAYVFLSQKWHFDQISNELIILKTMNFGYRSSFQLIDKGNIEVFGPSGTAFNLQSLSKNFINLQSGFVANYAFIMTLTFMLVFTFLLNYSGVYFGFLPVIVFSYWVFSFTFE